MHTYQVIYQVLEDTKDYPTNNEYKTGCKLL